jgi:hypothetical protein
MSNVFHIIGEGKNDPLEFKLTEEQRLTLKDFWKARFHETGEGRNRSTNMPEVADIWINAVCDYLVSCGYEITKRREVE